MEKKVRKQPKGKRKTLAGLAKHIRAVPAGLMTLDGRLEGMTWNLFEGSFDSRRTGRKEMCHAERVDPTREQQAAIAAAKRRIPISAQAHAAEYFEAVPVGILGVRDESNLKMPAAVRRDLLAAGVEHIAVRSPLSAFGKLYRLLMNRDGCHFKKWFKAQAMPWRIPHDAGRIVEVNWLVQRYFKEALGDDMDCFNTVSKHEWRDGSCMAANSVDRAYFNRMFDGLAKMNE